AGAGRGGAQPGQPGPENDRTMTVAGRVLDPDGKPAAGAQVAVVAHRTRPTDTTGQREERLGLTQADGEGRFRLQVRRTASTMDRGVNVLAARAGLGLGWQALHPHAESPEVTVRLHPEQPLRGRLVGLEGQPAAGVKLYLAYVAGKDTREDRDQVWFAGLHERWEPWPAPVTTDEQGRFVVRGVGRGF